MRINQPQSANAAQESTDEVMLRVVSNVCSAEELNSATCLLKRERPDNKLVSLGVLSLADQVHKEGGLGVAGAQPQEEKQGL